MNTLLHHFRKDLRFARWLILATLLVSAVVLWVPAASLEVPSKQTLWFELSRYGGWLMLLLTSGHLIQLDAPTREGAFFRTKPVPLATLLPPKCLVILMLIVPMALFECLLLLLLGLRPGAMELIFVFAENLLILAAIAAIGMAMALREDSARKFNGSVVGWGGILFIGWIAFTWFQSSHQRTEKPDWSFALEYLKISRLLMAQLVALTGTIIGVVLFARSRRRETITKSLTLTAVCVLAAWFFWPLNFVRACVPAQREAPKNEWPDPAKLKITINPSQHSQSRFIKYGNRYNGLTYRTINSYLDIKGLSPDWHPNAANGYRSEIVLPDGRVIRRYRESFGQLHPTAILHQLKMKPDYPAMNDREWQAELAEFKLESYAGSLKGATMKGELLLPLNRAVILARAPFKEGLLLHVPHRQIQIPRIEVIGYELHWTLLEVSSSCSLHGGATRLSENGIAFLVIQKDRGEWVQSNGGDRDGDAAGPCFLRRENFQGLIFPPDQKKPVTPEWLAGAELLVIGQEYGGTITQSFDFSDVNLSTDP